MGSAARCLEGRVAVVTGGASGSGLATATLLAEEGADVVIADRDGPGAARAVELIAGRGGTAEAVAVDIADPHAVADLADHLWGTRGRVDVLHNSAALTDPSHQARDVDVVGMDAEAWDRTLAVDLTGTMLVCRAVLPLMLGAGGAVVNVSSNAGLAGGDGLTGYAAAKAGLHQLTRSIATAYGRHGVRCNALSPGHVASPSFLANVAPEVAEAMRENCLLPRLGRVDDIARVALFLASDASAGVTGQVLRVDGGALAHLTTHARRPRLASPPTTGTPPAPTGVAGAVAVVTAVGEDVGRACAEWLAAAGALVVAVDRPGPGGQAEAVAQSLRDAGGTARACAVDLAAPSGVAELAAQLMGRWADLRVVVDGEAIRSAPPLTAAAPGVLDAWATVSDRLRAALAVGEGLGPRLAASGGGALVHLAPAGSLAGDAGDDGRGVVGGGIVSWSRALAARLGPAAVRSNVVCVGERDEVALGSTLLPDLPSPADVASVVGFLASGEASFVTGVALSVDGGQSAHLPHLDRRRHPVATATPGGPR